MINMDNISNINNKDYRNINLQKNYYYIDNRNNRNSDNDNHKKN